MEAGQEAELGRHFWVWVTSVMTVTKGKGWNIHTGSMVMTEDLGVLQC